MIFSLVYKSEAILGLDKDEIQKMLVKARSFNDENKISGCLLYHKGEFLQYIEGEENVLLNLFRRIKEDSRHTNVTLLSYDYTLERVFENWEMAYEDFSRTNHQLQYLKLLVSLFVENPNISSTGSPTSNSFWNMVKRLLSSESIDR